MVLCLSNWFLRYACVVFYALFGVNFEKSKVLHKISKCLNSFLVIIGKNMKKYGQLYFLFGVSDAFLPF